MESHMAQLDAEFRLLMQLCTQTFQMHHILKHTYNINLNLINIFKYIFYIFA